MATVKRPSADLRGIPILGVATSWIEIGTETHCNSYARTSEVKVFDKEAGGALRVATCQMGSRQGKVLAVTIHIGDHNHTTIYDHRPEAVAFYEASPRRQAEYYLRLFIGLLIPSHLFSLFHNVYAQGKRDGTAEVQKSMRDILGVQ